MNSICSDCGTMLGDNKFCHMCGGKAVSPPKCNWCFYQPLYLHNKNCSGCGRTRHEALNTSPPPGMLKKMFSSLFSKTTKKITKK